MYFCAGAPRTFQSLTNVPLRLHKTPRKDLGACNATLGHGGRRGSGQFCRHGSTPGLESGRARLGAHLGRRGGRGLSGGVADEDTQRRPAVTAAATRGDGEEGAWLGNARP
jgi:hypothetical protein